jgi:predicted TIM-barrel fold metal-dependent hydrolase
LSVTDCTASRADWLDGIELIDAHHHFWQLGRFPYRWLDPAAPPARFGDKAAIQKDFLPPDFLGEMAGLPLVASVHVQANCGAKDPAEETRWLHELSVHSGWPTAAIAEVDLTAVNAIELIDRHRSYTLLRGIRTPVAWDTEGRWRVSARPNVMQDPRFRDAARHLAKHKLVMECVVVPSQLDEVAALAQAESDLTIVINHFATLEPQREGNAEQWREGVSALSDLTNVFVKLSGLWTVDKGWSAQVLKPFVAHLVDSLGASRVLWGSNMPVEGVNCPIPAQFEQLKIILADRSREEIALIFGGTAKHVFRI